MYRKLMLTCVVLVVVAGGMPVRAGLEDGLVTYFKLDEGIGTVAMDSSGNENHGTLIGNNLSWVKGYDGASVFFNVPETVDVGDRLEFPTAGMSVNTGTIAMWAYLTDPQPGTSGRYLFGHSSALTGRSFADRFQIYLQDPTPPLPQRYSRKLDIGLGGSHTTKLDIVELPLKEWVHVAVTWNNGAYVVYVGGVQVDSGTYTGLTRFKSIANFGNDGCGDPYEAFCGMLDECRVYNRALTAAEMTAMVKLPAVPVAPRIRAWDPSPADGSRNVVMSLLSWKAQGTILLHNVYVGRSPDLTDKDLISPRTPLKMAFYVPPLVPGTTYYWRVDGIDPVTGAIHAGDVWSFLAQPLTAYDPIPAAGSNTVGLAPNLKWSAGKPPVLKHRVYFSTDPAAVKNGTAAADRGERNDPNFAPGKLEPLTTYYWRVDQIGAAGAVQTGKVWTFTTLLSVDDMESYTDAEGKRIYETWIDGWSNKTGSQVGYDTANQGTFGERTVVYSGRQSMPLDFNNVKAPFYSEAERTFAANQNWTAEGADTLVLFLRWKAGSRASPVYVELKDAQNRTGMAVAEAATISAGRWTEWKIPFSAFEAAGVNLARVKTIYLGVGDKAKPAAGGTGVLFVDDISLAKTVPALP
ncbi:MAG: LamG domain-containing protein [Planctomycetes bacterium]|nr:LamG domain-containing protein [Planctomycetota bacterium]